MRKIKFKAWDVDESKMLSDWQREFGLIEHFGFNGGGRFLLLQFTGLTDKNGKELYEGDCFSIDSRKTGTRIGIATVIWNERHLCYELEDTLKHGEYNIHWFANNKPVIGNIYENANLLK